MKTIFFLWIALVLPLSSTLSAAELIDEKRYAAPQPAHDPGQTPQRDAIGVEPSQPRSDGSAIIVPSLPEQKKPVILVPALPESPASQLPGRPVQPGVVVVPDAQQIDPAVKTPDAITPARISEEKKPEVVSPPVPEKSPEKLLTPSDFLPLTPQAPKTAEEKKKTPDSVASPKKEPMKEKRPSSKDKAPQKGDLLKIPEEAAKSGKLDFLEGCWVGTRPEYGTKRIIKERFCFDKNGVGKRFIYDPRYAGECVGATKALVNSGGVLRMSSAKMFCTSGDRWGASEMTCQGEGEQTPCAWVFHDVNNARQSYKIQFVRE